MKAHKVRNQTESGEVKGKNDVPSVKGAFSRYIPNGFKFRLVSLALSKREIGNETQKVEKEIIIWK